MAYSGRYDEDEENSRNRVREVSISELAKDRRRSKVEEPPSRRRRIEATDPYFEVLDSGRDFLVWFRKHKDFKKELTNELKEVTSKLEKLIHKVQTAAINDDFDYSASYNDAYFDMGEIFKLLTNFKAKMSVLVRNEKHMMSAMGLSPKGFSAYKAELRKLSDICGQLEKRVRTFMEELEMEYGLDPILPKRKDLSLSHS